MDAATDSIFFRVFSTLSLIIFVVIATGISKPNQYASTALYEGEDFFTERPDLTDPGVAAVSKLSVGNIDIEAVSAYVVEMNSNRVIFEKNSSVPLPLASLTKVMMAYSASKLLADSTEVVVTSEHLLAPGDSGLHANERWSFSDLRNFTLITSSNDGARALAERYAQNFQGAGIISLVDSMNSDAHSLGLTTMHFLNTTGLDSNELINGGYSSAADMAKLFGEIYRRNPEILEITSRQFTRFKSIDGIIHDVTNTNEITSRIPSLIASKTGYTVVAGGNLAVIFDVGVANPVVAVVLGSSFEGRFRDMEKIINEIFQRQAVD